MLRRIIKAVAIRHDLVVAPRLGELGVDRLKRNRQKNERCSRRRLRRTQGRFPWWGLGWLWTWLYKPYHVHCETKDKSYLASLSTNQFVRETLRRQAIERKVVPPDLLSS